MEKNIKYSFVVPVYNTKSIYLEQCISSILNQIEITEFELIIVNDGSTNLETLSFINKLKNNKTKVFSIANSGVSVARNTGILKSSGRFLIFVDADDFLEVDFLSNIDKKVEENKLLLVKNSKYNDCKKTFSKKAVLNRNVVWAKVFDKEVIKKNNILFLNNLRYCEDSIFLNLYNQFSEGEILIDCALYNYRINNFNATNSYDDKADIHFNESLKQLSRFNTPDDIVVLSFIFFIDFVLTKQVYHAKNTSSNKDKNKNIKQILNNPDFLYHNFISTNINKNISFIRKVELLLVKHGMYKMVFILNNLVSRVKNRT